MTTDSTASLSLFDNPATRCPVALLLDTSSSMAGRPIEALNDGFVSFIREVMADECARFAVELAVVTFGGGATIAQPFTPMAGADLDRSRLPVFTASGDTPMGAALTAALAMLEERKRFYRDHGIPYYQPWMVLLTDGAPTDEVAEASRTVHRLCADRKLVFFGVGVGDGANMDRLGAICPPNRPPRRLQGLRFAEFFQWLSRSMASVSRSAGPDARVALPPADGWAAI